MRSARSRSAAARSYPHAPRTGSGRGWAPRYPIRGARAGVRVGPRGRVGGERGRRCGGGDPKPGVSIPRTGRRVRRAGLPRRFATLVTELGLPPVRLHDLRHAAASIAAAAGVDLKVIHHDVGHSSALTTADTYVTMFRQTAQAAVRATAGASQA